MTVRRYTYVFLINDGMEGVAAADLHAADAIIQALDALGAGGTLDRALIAELERTACVYTSFEGYEIIPPEGYKVPGPPESAS